MIAQIEKGLAMATGLNSLNSIRCFFRTCLRCWLRSIIGNHVTGAVTYNGEPVKKGFISFRPSDGHGQSFAVGNC